jgi:hypothetical protein
MKVLFMNARMKLIARKRTDLSFVSCEGVGANLPAGRRPKLRKKMERMLLLLRSPIASLRWARAKSQALAKKKQDRWQSRWRNSFAQCEQDGIIMGF